LGLTMNNCTYFSIIFLFVSWLTFEKFKNINTDSELDLQREFDLKHIPEEWVNCIGSKIHTNTECSKLCLDNAAEFTVNKKEDRLLSTNISCHKCPNSPGTDTIFSYIENQQKLWKTKMGSSIDSFGSVLDVGTGESSLRWIMGLNTSSWNAISASYSMIKSLNKYENRMRRGIDSLILGDWMLPGSLTELENRTFDLVLVDYVLAAMEAFSPFYQDLLFKRLKPHVSNKIYVVGQEPYRVPYDRGGSPPYNLDITSDVVFQIFKLRDSCQLIGGSRFYREYPVEWVVRSLESSGYKVDDIQLFPINWGYQALLKQIQVCDHYVKPNIRTMIDIPSSLSTSTLLKDQMKILGNMLKKNAQIQSVGACFGMDWVVSAHL